MLSSSLKVAILAASTFYCGVCVEADGRCWWPDGILAKNVRSCNPNSTDSGCCPHGDYCTTTGYCLSSTSYYYYRAACTDRSWRSSSCPQMCLEATVADTGSTWVGILACGDRSGSWCCAYTEPCCNDTFQNPPLGSLMFSAQITSTVTGGPTVTNIVYSTIAPTPIPDVTDNSRVTIGLAVGIPLTVIASAAALYAFWLYRELYHPVGRQKSTQIASAGEPSGGRYDGANSGAKNYVPLQEIEPEDVHG